MPDGTTLSIGSERIQIPETLFTQNASVEGFTGLQNMVTEAIGRTDIDIRRDLFVSVIIAGGNASFKGTEERLQRLIPEVAP